MRQRLVELQGEIDEITIVAGDVNTSIKNGQTQLAENQQRHS